MKPLCVVCKTPSPFLLKKDSYDLYRCSKCELVFVHPQPQETFLKEKVYSFESGYQSNKKGDFGTEPKDEKTRRIFEKLAAHGKNRGNLLDVGCSSGEFMHYAQLQGFVADGVELNRRTSEVAKAHGLNVFNGFLKDAGFAPNFFDVIFLGDIIEHVTSPEELIIECSRILKKGGLIIISTPNLDCLWSKMTYAFYTAFKIPWSSVTPPYHLFQFSVGNLDRFLENEGYLKSRGFFLRPPRLMYELGSLHLLKKYKQKRSIPDFLFMMSAFALYTVAYGIDVLVSPFKKKDFSMVMFYSKSHV